MGEQFAGPWIDRRTGKTIYVRDAIQDGDELVIMTNMGQIPTEEFQQYYVQMSEEDYGNGGITPQMSQQQALATINKGLDETEKITFQKPSTAEITLDTPIGNDVNKIKKETPKQETKNETKPAEKKIEIVKSMNYSLIEKVMDKYQNAITMTFEANPDEWPKAELQMLINTFDVTADEICDYIIDKYLNKESLLEPFKDYLMTILEIDKNNV